MSDLGAYMLDTTVFNRVLDGEITRASLVGRRLLVTGVQRDELDKTRDATRRKELLATFDVINPDSVPASSFALDIEGAGLDQAYWNDGSGKFEKMRVRLQELDRKKNEKRKLNQERDILIAETAINNGATLVSDDCNLRQVVSEFGGRVIESAKLSLLASK